MIQEVSTDVTDKRILWMKTQPDYKPFFLFLMDRARMITGGFGASVQKPDRIILK